MPFSRRRPRPRPPPAPQEPPPEWMSQRQLGASIPWVSTLEEKAFDDEWAAATADVKARHEAEKARERPPPDQKAIEAAEAKRDAEAKNFREECDRILALDDGESILRWRGAGWVEDDPFNTPIGLGTRWQELNRKTPRMLHYIHRSCPWEALSPSCRAWFATWIPEAKAKAIINSESNTSLWGVAVRRVIWEQLLSSERPDDLWLGPHWAAFGKVESELRCKLSIPPMLLNGKTETNIFPRCSIRERCRKRQARVPLCCLTLPACPIYILPTTLCSAWVPQRRHAPQAENLRNNLSSD
jgi:hypothetical protein